MFALEDHTIFLTLAGSQAHGTAREGSDVDLRGVCIAPLPVRLSLGSPFEQYEGPLPESLAAGVHERLLGHPTAARGLAVKSECVIFDVAKLLRLCVAANPNALEILFADPRDWLLESASWRRLYQQRQQFLTRKVQQSFVGYAQAQLKKIQSHRTASLQERVNPRRNPARAALEKAHGYDTKHAMHLVRLMRMGIEALRSGELHVRRPDADELAAIRDGALSFDELLALSTHLQATLAETARTSQLPADVDPVRVDQLLLTLVRDV